MDNYSTGVGEQEQASSKKSHSRFKVLGIGLADLGRKASLDGPKAGPKRPQGVSGCRTPALQRNGKTSLTSGNGCRRQGAKAQGAMGTRSGAAGRGEVAEGCGTRDEIEGAPYKTEACNPAPKDPSIRSQPLFRSLEARFSSPRDEFYREVSADRNTATEIQTQKHSREGREAAREPTQNDRKPQKPTET
jgi:hypothetical protein